MTRLNPKIVLAHWAGVELFDAGAMSRLSELGQILDDEPIGDWSDPRADRLLADAQVIVGHWGCPLIDINVVERAPNLGLFAYAAGTIKGTVDITAFDRGIRITSGANANAEPVVEFSIAAILFANKDVFWQRDLLRDRTIEASRVGNQVPVGNYSKTIGVVGASLIGRRVIELLGNFPHLAVALYDPFVDEAEADHLGVRKCDLDDLCARSDVLTIHAPSLPETKAMIGARQLAALRTGATVINTARAAIVDQDALISELEAGRLYAILDVADPEPLPSDHRLLSLPNAFVTPHLAGSQGSELIRMTDYVIDEVARWIRDEPGRNEISATDLRRLA
ncbi:MAG: hydroxyacid dehydrogenase [Acidobacteria bacterium]|nr:hydroxyacid dehydrogenase [Acidobacteriota bacterium]